MSIVNSQIASVVVSALLRGTQLCSIRVDSSIIQVQFIRFGNVEGMPKEVWINVSGSLITDATSLAWGSKSSEDFFVRRASVLGEVYFLNGEEVTDAYVSDSGALKIQMGDKYLCAESDHDDFEEVWAVMNDDPSTSYDHHWYVMLDDAGDLSAIIPDWFLDLKNLDDSRGS